MTSDTQIFKPLVVGAPRSGFALLCSVVIHFLPLVNHQRSLRQQTLNALLNGMGDFISNSIVEQFAKRGISKDLLYNPNFRYIVGGPKWLAKDNHKKACFRKYIGVKGKGDFTLITSHPREVLNLDDIVHSHVDPALWLEHTGYSDYTKFASVRSPIDILNSSVFSLNALASEYIQKFIPPEQDNDTIRQSLALYKFTDMNFFEGLVKFLAGYFEEFMSVHDRYILMRWEDLISQPVPTILELANRSGINMTEAYAANIWKKLDHVNLTQAHKHNYRVGHGVLDGWKHWITNHHLDMIRSYGLEKHMLSLGYDSIKPLNEANYSPFQQKVDSYIKQGLVHDEFFDPDLFTFAFNKSNLVSDKFPFKRYEWRTHTQIERSIFEDEALQSEVWDCAEQACSQINSLLTDYLSESEELNSDKLSKLLVDLQKKHAPVLGKSVGKQYEDAFENAQNQVKNHRNIFKRSATVRRLVHVIKNKLPNFNTTRNLPESLPQLIATEKTCNVVEFNQTYYALPHKLGEIQVDKQSVSGLPGVLVTRRRDEALEYAREFEAKTEDT